MKRRGYFILPNILTAGSLFFGFLSITRSLSGDFYLASIFILIAGLLDGIDGKVARLTGTESRFGMEFDSLSDLVSFGLAPAILMYLLFFEPYERVGIAIPFLYVSSGALRLARFNVISRRMDPGYFLGLPIPASALSVVTPIILSERLKTGFLMSSYFYFPLSLILSLLMISNIKYVSFKKFSFLRRSPWKALITIVVAFTVLLSEPEIFLFGCAYIYLLSGPVSHLLRILKLKKKKEVLGEAK